MANIYLLRLLIDLNIDRVTSVGCQLAFIDAQHVFRRFTDIDECQTESRCQHVCLNSIGSFHCTCPNGYQLSANGRTCQGNGVAISSATLLEGTCSDLSISRIVTRLYRSSSAGYRRIVLVLDVPNGRWSRRSPCRTFDGCFRHRRMRGADDKLWTEQAVLQQTRRL